MLFTPEGFVIGALTSPFFMEGEEEKSELHLTLTMTMIAVTVINSDPLLSVFKIYLRRIYFYYVLFTHIYFYL